LVSVTSLGNDISTLPETLHDSNEPGLTQDAMELHVWIILPTSFSASNQHHQLLFAV